MHAVHAGIYIINCVLGRRPPDETHTQACRPPGILQVSPGSGCIGCVDTCVISVGWYLRRMPWSIYAAVLASSYLALVGSSARA